MASQVMLTMTYRTCIVDEQAGSQFDACINLSLGDYCALTDYKQYVIHTSLLLLNQRALTTCIGNSSSFEIAPT